MADLTLSEQYSQIKINNIVEQSIVISNCIELATSVIVKIAGKDIADTLNKQSLSRSMLSNLVANRIKEKVLSR